MIDDQGRSEKERSGEYPCHHGLLGETRDADELVDLRGRALPDNLSHDGCEAISVQRNQDDHNNVMSLTQNTRSSSTLRGYLTGVI